MVNHPPSQQLEYNEIIDGIFVGTNQCCQTHFEEELLAKDIRADLSLEAERIDAPFGVPFYVWLPVKDKTAPTQEQLRFGVHCLKQWVSMNVQVYAHCQNGHGRAPTMLAAYLIQERKMEVDEAIEFVRERRPSIHIEDVQMESLKEFASSVK